jgi:Protein of unknown function (DUF2851)
MSLIIHEDLLHYAWRHRRFDATNLETTQHQFIEILTIGTHNPYNGPDFFNARLRIDDTIWAGNVEMHVLASDWNAHKHSDNEAYNNVILHVVWEEDAVIIGKDGQAIPCIELSNRIDRQLITIYKKLIFNELRIPCFHHFAEVSDITKQMWLERLLIERIEQKTEKILPSLTSSHDNWEETFYRALAANFGTKPNQVPFEAVANALPLQILAKHKHNFFQIEALFFGQAGFLEEEFTEEYPKKLQAEYRYLRAKWQLAPALTKAQWHFRSLRPANFPTIRLAQFAVLVDKSIHLFSKILEAETVQTLQTLLKVALSDFWLTHYTFEKTSKSIRKTLGKDTIELLIINTIVPFLFLYGKKRGNDALKERAITFLETTSPEKNSIIETWEALAVQPKSAADTQALLQLKNNYCDKKRCLECAIGHSILKKV